MIQAVFFDIDGTLIDHGHGSVVPASTTATLCALRRKGVKLFVATGRYPDFLDYINGIFPFDGFVLMNGQLVMDREGQVLHRMPHRSEAIEALQKLQEKDPFPCVILEEKESFCFSEDPEIAKHYSHNGVSFPPRYDSARLKSHPVLQFLAYMPWEERDRLSPIPYIRPVSAGGNIIDVIPEGGGKEKGIAAAAAHYGFSREEIMVVGDNLNDIDMLRWGGVGVAMGNGVEKAKAAADYVTTPIDKDGIKNAMLHFGVLTQEDFA